MNDKTWRVNTERRTLSVAAVVAMTVLVSGTVQAQVPVDDEGNLLTDDYAPLDNGVQVENPNFESGELLKDADIETLIGPIALYPDDLLAIVLPASTYPLEIVQAARFVEAAALNPDLKPDEEWDDSIVALLNYPDVLKMMNEDIDWTWQLGEAVVDQQTDVITAIESFRDRAYAAGNLKSDSYQTVSVDDGVIEIEPVNDDVIYVPYYEPEQVVHYAPEPVYHYYPRAYPVYYYPYATNHYFGSRPFWGVTTAFTIGWASDRLHVYHHSYNGHPYYGRTYYGSYWRRPSINLYNNYYVNRQAYRPQNRYRVGDYWRPRHRSGPRPKYRSNRSGYRVRQDAYRPAGNYRGQRNNDRTVGTRRTNGNAGRTVAGNRNTNRQANNQRQSRRGNDQGEIRFRPRGDGAYSATREQRLQRAGRRNNATRDRNRSANATRVRNNADAIRTKERRTERRNSANRNQQVRASNASRDRSGASQAGGAKRVATVRNNRRNVANRNDATSRTSNRRSSAGSNRASSRRDVAANRGPNQASRSAGRRNVATTRNRAAKQADRSERARAGGARQSTKRQSTSKRSEPKKSQARRSDGGKRANRKARKRN